MSAPEIRKCSLESSSVKSSVGPTVATSSLKYLENFDNPYVKIMVACKVCGKEQKLTNPGNWKSHFVTHASAEEKAFPCNFCDKAFTRNNVLRDHILKKHPEVKSEY